MASWRTLGSVVAGVGVTIGLSALALVVLPLLGRTVAHVVGDWLPTWLLAVPSVLCAVAGGATTGFLSGRTRTWCAVLGGTAAALGAAVLGVVVGFALLVLILGMTPAHGQETNLSALTFRMLSLGGGTGFVVGAVLGAAGGVVGHLGRTGGEG